MEEDQAPIFRAKNVITYLYSLRNGEKFKKKGNNHN
jgi:hypothetical protein